MPTDRDRINYLLTRYIGQDATADEATELFAWISETDDADLLRAQVLEYWNSNQAGEEGNVPDFEGIYASIRRALPIKGRRRTPLVKIGWFRVAAAAILLVLATRAIVYFSRTAPGIAVQSPAFAGDKPAPAGNKAILTLADGSTIRLDSATNGTLAHQGSTKVLQAQPGQLAYQPGLSASSTGQPTTYNTLSVPRGSQPVQLRLADGSRVWLNVASSITYPTSFTGKQRKVQVDGEAYFEIAKGASLPFYVEHKGLSVRVLGTRFNVNTYGDEAAAKITLLDGAVQVARTGDDAGKTLTLQPGQQASVGSSETLLIGHPDLEATMAWKDGRFYFDGTDIRTIMRQVEKWYDMDVQYQSDPSSTFVAKISRDVKVSELLRILELTELVHFKIEGNKITVMK